MNNLIPEWWPSDNPWIIDDCIKVMLNLPKESIDMILCDLPYGTTKCSWDTIIPFDKMWSGFNHIIKPNGAIVLTASQPFTSLLVTSNLKMFRHSWIYKKRCASNFAQAKYSPMKEHEDILVFGKEKVKYFPIKENRKGSGSERVKYSFSDATRHKSGEFVGSMNGEYNEKSEELRFPSSVQEFNNRAKGDRGLHPTQKPVALFEYLIKTYSNPNDIIFDGCLGSGTTLVACKNTNRIGLGCEINSKDEKTIKNRGMINISNVKVVKNHKAKNISKVMSLNDFLE